MEIPGLILAMIVTGAAGGLLAGLLGIGGGIVIVPVLEIVLEVIGVDPAVRMHIAIGTSLATIIPTSIASALAHHRRSSVSVELVKYWSPYIVLGAIGGSVIAGVTSGQTLAAIFAFVAGIAAIKMMLPLDNKTIADDVPRGIVGPLAPTSVGVISAMMGIGGGSLSVPFMTLCNKPVHLAVGTSAVFGAFIAIPGAVGFIYSGWGNELLPTGSLGYVNLLGVALIVPTTIMFAPLGAKLAHALPRRKLSLLFGAFLFVVAIRMAYKAFS